MRASNILLNIILALSALKTGLVSAAYIEEEGYNHDLDQIEGKDADIIGHDSINNKENVLNIRDDFPVYENFKFVTVTQEKTIYITESASTVFITVTRTVTSYLQFPTDVQTVPIQTKSETTPFTSTVDSSFIKSAPISSSETKEVSTISSESMVSISSVKDFTSASTTISLVTSVSLLPSSPIDSESPSSSSISTSTSSSSISVPLTGISSETTESSSSLTTVTASITPVVSDTTTSVSTSQSETSKEETTTRHLDKFFTTRGSLDMILGDRGKFLESVSSTSTETLVSETSTESETSVTKSTDSSTSISHTNHYPHNDKASESTVPSSSAVSNGESTTSQTYTTSSSSYSTSAHYYQPVPSTLTIQTLTPIASLVPPPPFTTIGPTVSSESSSESFTSSSTSSYYHSKTPVATNSTHHNDSGLEQLLKNFSPYTDLPHAEFELANGAVHVDTFSLLQAVVAGAAVLVLGL